MQQAVLDAVGKINNKSDEEPDHETDPGDGRKSRHQEDAGGDTEERDDRAEGDFEGAVLVRFFDAEDDHTE